MGKLKPCPFCGGEAHVRIANPNSSIADYEYEVGCDNYECHGYYCKHWTVYESELEKMVAAWNQRAERTCHMTLKKSGPFYDVWHFECCDKEWPEPRCDGNVIDYPGVVCPYCGAKVVE